MVKFWRTLQNYGMRKFRNLYNDHSTFQTPSLCIINEALDILQATLLIVKLFRTVSSSPT
jgi:hypothetical protein